MTTTHAEWHGLTIPTEPARRRTIKAQEAGAVLWRQRGESKFNARAFAADLLCDAGMWRRERGTDPGRQMWRRAFYGARNRRINASATGTWSRLP